MVPDGTGGHRPGSAIGGVPSFGVMKQMEAQGQAPQAFNGKRFDPSQGEQPRRAPEGFARSVVGDSQGRERVTDTKIAPGASRFGTFQNRDGTFTALGASGNQGGFRTEEEARVWSRASFDPKNFDPSSPVPSPTPAAPPAAGPAQPQIVQAVPSGPPVAIAPPKLPPPGASMELGRGGELLKEKVGEFASSVMESGRQARERLETGRARVYGPAGEEPPPPAAPRVTPADRFANWISPRSPNAPPVAQVTAPFEIRTVPDFGDPAKDAERPRKRRERVAQTAYGF